MTDLRTETRTVRVLVVEDEPVTALDLRARLSRFGYEVIGPLASGEEAVGAARSEHPDLVLMDVRLTGEMDGIAAALCIRSDLDVPIVFLTAYSDDGTVRRAKSSGPFGFLVKPFDERDLYSTIEVALERHRTERELRESRQRLRELARQVDEVRERERTRVAREIHDDLCQTLAALRLEVSRTAGRVAAEGGPPANAIAEALDRSLATMRGLIADLRPNALDDIGVVAAVRLRARGWSERFGRPCEVRVEADLGPMAPAHQTAVFRSIEELLELFGARGDPTRLDIVFDWVEETLVVEVRDVRTVDRGEATDTAGDPVFVGLSERMAAIGGEVDVDWSAAEGGSVTLRIAASDDP